MTCNIEYEGVEDSEEDTLIKKLSEGGSPIHSQVVEMKMCWVLQEYNPTVQSCHKKKQTG